MTHVHEFHAEHALCRQIPANARHVQFAEILRERQSQVSRSIRPTRAANLFAEVGSADFRVSPFATEVQLQNETVRVVINTSRACLVHQIVAELGQDPREREILRAPPKSCKEKLHNKRVRRTGKKYSTRLTSTSSVSMSLWHCWNKCGC